MGSSIGHLFRLHTFGESHGAAVGGIIDGIPPGLNLDLQRVQAALDRRNPSSAMGSGRKETDKLEVLSGLQDGVTLGTALAFLVRNKDAKPSDYASLEQVWRPSHGDFTTEAKFGLRARSGGGRASARETVSRVVAGAIAEQVLPFVEIVAWVSTINDIESDVETDTVSRADVELQPTRCPDPAAAARMEAAIADAKDAGDTLGGIIRCTVRGLPPGLGDPVFDKLEATLGHALLSLPAVKGFEIGSGFSGTRLMGSQHNDAFIMKDGDVQTRTNHSGGVQAGISNGMPINLAVAFKPVASIGQAQQTIDSAGSAATLEVRGRHDACVLPRAVPIVESMVAIVLADHYLRWRGQCGTAPHERL